MSRLLGLLLLAELPSHQQETDSSGIGAAKQQQQGPLLPAAEARAGSSTGSSSAGGLALQAPALPRELAATLPRLAFQQQLAEAAATVSHMQAVTEAQLHVRRQGA